MQELKSKEYISFTEDALRFSKKLKLEPSAQAELNALFVQLVNAVVKEIGSPTLKIHTNQFGKQQKPKSPKPLGEWIER